MYSTVGLLKNSPVSGKLAGTHQKLDRAARALLGKYLPRGVYFPNEKEILHFEGNRGPDGLKRKSPGEDEPMHFIIPDHDDGKLIGMIKNHNYNLRKALQRGDQVRAAFEAAWLAHAITDGLTPAHHVPLSDMTEQLMTNKEFVKVFGEPIKGIMHGDNFLQTARNNWLYWGAGGHMSKHIAFEYGAAVTTTALSLRRLTPKMTREDFYGVNLEREFYYSLHKIHALDMYRRFQQDGWTTALALECRDVLLPEIVRMVALGWAASVPEMDEKSDAANS